MRSIKETTTNTIIIKKSEFITTLIPCNDEKEIKDLIELYSRDDATHNCVAYRVGPLEKADDDGEPSGTAGLPMLNVLQRQKIDNVIAIVTRYFGGIKLGAGGLTRAYTNSVADALKEAEKVTNGQTTEPDKEEADTSELEKTMKEAEELRQEDYTEATYAVLKTRMEDAQKLLDADKTEISQEDVDQALENLNQALALLEKKDDGEDDTTVYKNGIYEGRALCRPDEDEDFTAYNLTLKVTVRGDKIVAVTDVKGDGDSSNDRYILRAANGTSNKKGVTSQLIEKGNTEGIDAVSGATCTSKAILDACENALLSAKRQ